MQLSKESAIRAIIFNQWALGYSCLLIRAQCSILLEWAEHWLKTEKASLHSSPIAIRTPDLTFPTAVKGPAILCTYRQICIEIVFSVKQGLLVYAAVECQACHHCCFYTSPVENLRKHDTWFLLRYSVCNKCVSHTLPYMEHTFNFACLQPPLDLFPCVGSSYSSLKSW